MRGGLPIAGAIMALVLASCATAAAPEPEALPTIYVAPVPFTPGPTSSPTPSPTQVSAAVAARTAAPAAPASAPASSLPAAPRGTSAEAVAAYNAAFAAYTEAKAVYEKATNACNDAATVYLRTGNPADRDTQLAACTTAENARVQAVATYRTAADAYEKATGRAVPTATPMPISLNPANFTVAMYPDRVLTQARGRAAGGVAARDGRPVADQTG